jgi:hypothetical protein
MTCCIAPLCNVAIAHKLNEDAFIANSNVSTSNIYDADADADVVSGHQASTLMSQHLEDVNTNVGSSMVDVASEPVDDINSCVAICNKKMSSDSDVAQDEKVASKKNISAASIDTNAMDSSSSIGLLLSDDMKTFLSEGLVVPAYIQTTDDTSNEQSEPFADLYLSYTSESGLLLQKITLYKNLPFELDERFKKSLLDSVDAPFGNSQQLIINENANLVVDILSMSAVFKVMPNVFKIKSSSEDAVLGEASSEGMTDIFQYTINGYNTSSTSNNTLSAHLLVDNILSWQEHHINLKGYGYSSDYGDVSMHETELDELTYERDWEGRRFSAGMLQGWSLQSLGTVSTLNSQKLYGASYGNIAKSIHYDNSASLTPLVIYMPANGEVRVYRDGRLLDIQRLSMGNQELNTLNFPRGSYDVQVDVVVGGKVVSTRRYPVNKLHQKVGVRGLGWQVWGGVTEVTDFDDEVDSLGDFTYSEQQRLAPLLGLSLASNWGAAQWNTSVYNNDKTQVLEGQISLPVTEDFSFDFQGLVASDGSLRSVASINWSAMDGAINSWLSVERGHEGNRLDYSNGDTEIVGSNLYLGKWIPSAGTITLGYQQTRDIDQRYISANYSHNINTNYGYWTLAVGTNISVGTSITELQGQGGSEYDQEYYASVNVSIPLDTDFGIGVSHSGGERLFNFSARRNFEGPITGAGVDVSMAEGGFDGSNTRVNTFANYNTRYAQGAVSYSGSEDSHTVSLSNRGSIAMGGSGVAAGNGYGQSGIVVALPEDLGDGDLQASINHQHYPLHGGENLILVPSFNSHEVDIQRTEEAENAYEIELDQQAFTLYPGNVVYVDVGVKQMVTVFGRLANTDGEPLANAKVKNHIGEAMTDNEGNFSIDVDVHHPEIQVNGDVHAFKVEMALPHNEATAWLGDIIYNGPVAASYKITTAI